MEELIIQWTHATCGAPNYDDYVNTAIPYCGGCETDVEWDEIFTAEHLELLNSIVNHTPDGGKETE